MGEREVGKISVNILLFLVVCMHAEALIAGTYLTDRKAKAEKEEVFF